MTTTATELVSRAFYLSEIVSRDLETVSGSQSSDGLRMLNDLLDEKSMTGRYIPYYGHLSSSLIKGQQKYNFPGLIEVDAITFNIGDVRYAMQKAQRREYFGSNRVDNIESLPYQYYPERVLGGTDIYLYFSPADDYELKITGKLSLLNVGPFSNLRDQIDGFYISYLTYDLAVRLCEYYSVPTPSDIQRRLQTIESQLVNVEPLDFRVNLISSFPTRGVGMYGQANLGRGWLP